MNGCLLVTSVLSSLPSLAPAAIQESKSIQVLLVEESTERALPGATFRWIAEEDARGTWQEHGVDRPRIEDWLLALDARGHALTADEAGAVAFSRSEGVAFAAAESGGLFGCTWIESGAGGSIRLDLATDVAVEVWVLDDRGAPVHEAPVMLADADPAHRIHVSWLGTTSQDGVVRLRHAQTYASKGSSAEQVLTFAFPMSEPVSVPIDLSESNPSRKVLQLPPTGSLTVRGLEGEAAFARLRRKPAGAEAIGLWFRGLPWKLPAEDGNVVFPFVGLDLALELEIETTEPSFKETLSVRGPTAAGENVVAQRPTLDAVPTATGILLDLYGRPLAGGKVGGSLSTRTGGRFSARGFAFDTDADGRFSFAIPRNGFEEERYFLEVHSADSPAISESSRTIPVAAMIDLKPLSTPGVHDVGDVKLTVPLPERLDVDPTLWPPMEDDELAREVRRILREDPADWKEWEWIERALVEMVRRGGEHWMPLLEESLGLLAERSYADGQLEFLTALRRLQGKPDPLGVVIESPALLEPVFPDLPVVEYRVENMDVDGTTLVLMDGGSYRSGRFARFRFDVVPPSERSCTLLPDPSSFGGGLFQYSSIAPGVRLMQGAVPMSEYVLFQAPGDHVVRLQYHSAKDIASWDQQRVSRAIVSSSNPFVVRWVPREIVLSTFETEALLAAIAALDETQPVLLTRHRYQEGLEPEGITDDNARSVLEAGWKALPPLLGVLGDSKVSPARKAWILALLYDLTGVLDPLSADGVIGACDWCAGWRRKSPYGFDDSASNRSNGGGPSARAQEPFIEAWIQLSSLVRAIGER